MAAFLRILSWSGRLGSLARREWVLTYRVLTATLLVLVTACFLPGRRFVCGVTSSPGTSSVTCLRFFPAILSECLATRREGLKMMLGK